MTNGKRFVSWAAVSSLPQAKKISLEDQLKTNAEHISRHDGEVVAELVVPGESRNIVLLEEAARKIEAYQKSKDLIDAKSFDVLIYLDRSRLGRTAALSMTIAELCNRANILLYEVESPPTSLDFVSADHNDLILGAIKSVGAQQEINKLNERARKGMIGRVERGIHSYRLSWGYHAVYNEKGKLTGYRMDDDVAITIRSIIDMYLAGTSKREIAASLNRTGRPTPVPGNEWNIGRVTGIIDAIWRYAGYTEVNGQSQTGRPYLRAQGQWPPMIAQETAYAVLAERSQRINASKSIARTHRYSRCVYCTTCDRRMVASPDRRNGNVRYRCLEGHTSISALKISEYILSEIPRLDANAYRDNLIRNTDTDVSPSLIADIATHEAQVTKLLAGITRADDDYYIHSRLDDNRHSAIVAGAKRQIQQIQVEITKLQDDLNEYKNQEKRADRIEEVRRSGADYIKNPNAQAANAWMRHHFEIWVADCQVKALVIL